MVSVDIVRFHFIGYIDTTNTEEHVMAEAEWLFSIETSVALECLKKPRHHHHENKKVVKDPFRSERFLMEIK